MSVVSPNKSRYAPSAQLSPFLRGLKYFALKNTKGSFVIPSTKNFMDNYQIKKIECDDGATCTVLPIQDVAMLTRIFEKYRDSCVFSVQELRSVAGATKAMSISHMFYEPYFEFRLGLDVFPSIRRVARNWDGKKAFASSTELQEQQPIDDSSACNYEPF